MSITTYSELKTSVGNWLARSNLNSHTGDFVALGEKRIYRDLRIRAMETSLNSAIASGVLAVPSGYVEMKFAYIDGTPIAKIQKKDAEWIYHNYPTRSSDSKPKFFAREAENFIFGPYPDSTYTVKGVYYKRLDALSDSNTSNWFMVNAPDLLLFAALCEASPFLKADDRVSLWEAKYKSVKDSIQNEDNQEDVSGGPMAVTVR